MADDEKSNGLVEMTSIVSLASHRAFTEEDNRLWTPLDCLEEAIRDIKAGKIKVDKLVVMFVDTSDGQFGLSHYSANIKASEMLAAAECMKAKLFVEMGYY